MKGMLFSLLFGLILTSCSLINSRPAWIDDPGNGAVGFSSTHIKGYHFQKQLAVARAREQLAARHGVEVSSIQTINERVANESVSVTSDKVSQHRIKSNKVNAYVKETWHDKKRDEIWVWLYPGTP